MSSNRIVDITPETRVGPLLENRPELEPVLIALSPRFTVLKNPVLRRTVARVATLRQVARVGEVPLSELIRTLREAAGLEVTEVDSFSNDAAGDDWMNGLEPVSELDIGPWLEAGEQPLDRVMQRLNELKSGDVLALRAPFEPAPLMDLAQKKGFRVAIRSKQESDVVIWFHRSS